MNTNDIDKVELHCHLSGLLCPEYVEAIRQDGFNTGLDPEKMRSFYPITNLDTWNALLDYSDPFTTGQGELLLAVLKKHLQFLRTQHVRYVEIMLDSFLGAEQAEILLHQYRRITDEWPDIEIGYIGTMCRTPDREKFERKAQRILSLWRHGLLDGFAIACEEELCRIRDYADVFNDLVAAGIPIEIHAGETTGPEFIWDALEYGRPRRLGHALSLFDDPALVTYVLANDIHIEFCPTSNLKVGSVRELSAHPVFRAMDAGINFSINTDDPGVFECSMNSEFELLQSVTHVDTATIFANSLRSAFGEVPDS